MNELTYVYGTAGLMVATFAIQVIRKRFDPFAPVWMFFVGYFQIYVVQARSYHDWAVDVRGVEVVTEANFRAFWALSLFLGLYFFGPGRQIARLMPKPPMRWGSAPVAVLSPLLVIWGLFCSGVLFRSGEENAPASPEAALALSFPLVMLVGGVALVVTGRQPARPRPAWTAAGVGVVAMYMLIWMFNGKRSHSLVAVLVGVCSFYIPRLKRPSFPVLGATAACGLLAVGISIGWRYYAYLNPDKRGVAHFAEFVSNWDPESILESINLKDRESSSNVKKSYETEEYGAYLLMVDTVPAKSDHDYGANYLRCFSTFIPRLIWADKPIYGRDQWTSAWVAGSEFKRENTFTGPAIGILGATQLNGGSTGTFLVLSFLAVFLKSSYEYFRLYSDLPWVQTWWALSFYNAWFMTVNDDPANWFYYNWGFTTFPSLAILWVVNKFGESGGQDA